MGCGDSRAATTVLSQKDEIMHLRREKEEAEKCLVELRKNIKQIYETTDELARECASLRTVSAEEYSKFVEKSGNLILANRGGLRENYDDVVKILNTVDEIQNMNLKFIREFIGKNRQTGRASMKGILKQSNLSGSSGKEIEEASKSQAPEIEINPVSIEKLEDIVQQLLKQHGNLSGRPDEILSTKDASLSTLCDKLELLRGMAPKTQRTIRGIGQEMEDLINSYSKMQTRVTSLVESNRKEINLGSGIKFS